MTPIASIVIPAHNEAAVIGRLLDTLPREIDGRPLQIIVACNGCKDNTADVARGHGVTVVDIETGSKIAALNAADEIAVAFPRLYIDADVVLTRKTIVDLVKALSEPGALSAAPPYNLDYRGDRPWVVRAYFEVWLHVMKHRSGYVGSGVYAVSREGRARFGRFPNVIADDTYVRNLFSRDERRVVDTDPTQVEAPRTLKALIRRRVRVNIGNLELVARGHWPKNAENAVPWWRAVLSRPRLIPAGIVYGAVNAVAQIKARRQRRSKQTIDWGQDSTTRSTSTV
jgi:glycosyltransferase involved in cell wall biosynthesis